MKKKGFTLAETLITLAIIGIVAAVGIPQVVTMAQRHQSEAMVAKIVYQTELGVQKMFSDYKSDPDNKSASQVDKILLVKHWNEKLAIAMRLTEKTEIAALYNLLMASAYASTPDSEYNKVSSKTISDPCPGRDKCSASFDVKIASSQHGWGTITINMSCSTVSNIKSCTGQNVTNYEDGYSELLNTRGHYLDNPKPTDPISVNPKPSDPVPSDPVPSDPVPSDPVPSDPVPSDPAPSDPVPEVPVSDFPVPQGPEPVAGYEQIYHAFGLPAEVKLTVYNSLYSDAYNTNQDILTMIIDTNGFGKGKDKAGVDEFTFNLTNAGKMVPIDNETKEFVKNGYKIK